MEYMPSDWTATSKKTERPFFWSILISLAPQYVEQLVKDVREQRANQQQQRQLAPRPVVVGNNWVDQLLSQPYMSCAR